MQFKLLLSQSNNKKLEDLEEFPLVFILDLNASYCQDCSIKCIVFSEYYPTNKWFSVPFKEYTLLCY